MTAPIMWTKKRLEGLMVMHKCGVSNTVIGKRLNLSRSTVAAKIRELNLIRDQQPRQKRYPSNMWTEEDEAIARSLAPDHDAQQIADKMGRTKQSIIGKLGSMGVRSQQMVVLEKPKVVIAFPTFQDHPDGDSDRYGGRKPQREFARSLTGNSGALCCG